jgi:serine/threonine-protein kinase
LAPEEVAMSAAASRRLISFGAFEFDARLGLLYRGDEEIYIPPRACGVLECLLEKPGELVTKQELQDSVWPDSYVADTSLSEAVGVLRHALGDDPQRPTYIKTLHRRGYQLIAEVRAGPGSGQGGEALGRVIPLPPQYVGETLGKYKILGELGAGAMGIVYRAHDTVLEREVAIKVLPGDFMTNPGRVARLEQEAKLLASVSHPHIAAIHSLEESDGIRFPVLELVEGETLDQRLSAGPLRVGEALEIARQIASALEAAHERGVVHRDLKPANIKLTAGGQAKVLDFGLAKPLEVHVVGSGAASSPTDSLTIVSSRRGTIVGTAAYMSPEQARGEDVDERADNWAFGCILYEMLTGRRAFEGETVSGTVAGVLERQPDWELLPAATPRGARRVLRRCLNKDPRDRLHSMADARIELEEIGETEEMKRDLAVAGATDAAAFAATRRPLWRRALPWAMTGVAVGALAAGLAFWASGLIFTPASAPVSHLLIDVEPDHHLWGGQQWEVSSYAFRRPSRSAFAFAPDGRYLVYAATADEADSWGDYVQGGQLYLRRLDQPRARPIPGTQGGASPFVSPDGEWIGFFVHRGMSRYELKKVAVGGGDPQTILEEAPGSWGASWGDDGFIVIADGPSGGLLRLSAAGGAPPKPLTKVDRSRGETSHRLPQILPGSRAVLFTVEKGADWENAEIAVLSLETGEYRLLVEDGADARYVAEGYIVFVRRGTLLAAPFDPESLELRGEPARVLEDVMQSAFAAGGGQNTGAGQFSFSDSGLLAYIPGGIHPELERSLVRVDHEGNAEPLALPVGEYRWSRISPDGRQLVYTEGQKGRQDLWIYDSQQQSRRRLTSAGDNSAPVWSPDGQRIAFSSTRDGPVPNLYSMGLDDGQVERLTTSDHYQLASSWSVNGDLAFVQSTRDEPQDMGDIWVLPLAPGRPERAVVATPFSEGWPEFSPDGRWLAYGSDETGRFEVLVRPYPGPGAPVPVSIEGGMCPAWARDGRGLFFRGRDALGSHSRSMNLVEIVADDSFDPGKPRLLFQIESTAVSPVRGYDVTPSDVFVMPTSGQQELQPVTRINIALNWLEELQRLVPAES